MVQFVYKSLNIGTNSLMFRVIDVFILKSIKGLINLCIIGWIIPVTEKPFILMDGGGGRRLR